MTLKQKKLLVLISPAIIVLILDQISKYLVRSNEFLHNYTIIDGWLRFNYTQNPGMALGMDWLSTPSISTIAILATILIFIYIYKNLDKSNLAYLFCMGLILGGALGNISDRLSMGLIEGYGGILYGHVVDFIHFSLRINETPVFPYIFNVADIAISTSIIILLLFNKKIMPVPDTQQTGGEYESETVETAKTDSDSANEDYPLVTGKNTGSADA